MVDRDGPTVTGRRPVPVETCALDSPDLAVALLNKVLVTRIDGHITAGRIVETEAYREDDPASHSFRGRTARNGVMFGPPGHVYVYLSYGIHRCVNVVASPDGIGAAVLLRALEPVDGIEVMRRRRGGRADRQLTDGPGKLCQAVGIDLHHDGAAHTDPHGELFLADDGVAPPAAPLVGPRIGITKAVDLPWRFRVPRAPRGRAR